MRRLLGWCGALLLTACGGGRGEDFGTYFLPRAALDSVAAEQVKVVGTHDSGLLVQPVGSAGAHALATADAGFRFDSWQVERSRYRFQSVERKLEEFARLYPDIVQLDTYGTSRRGRPEYVLRIGKVDAAPGKPELMITGATHGNETITVDVVMGLIEKLLVGYGADERLTRMVDEHVVHFIPIVCVDSYIAQTRYNDGRDPNRDYPWPEDAFHRPVAAIGDIIRYFDARPIVGTMDYHAAGSMIMFPWAYTYDHIDHADYRRLDDLTTRMAATNGFAHGDIASTIYVAEGSSADYYYWKKHTMATAIEVSHRFAASGDHAQAIVDENTEATWIFIESFR